MKEFTHFDEHGNAIMVDVSEKQVTSRTAIAVGQIKVNDDIMQSIINQDNKKGDVLNVARVAGIMATKKTSEMIPMCHLLMLTKSKVDFRLDEKNNIIEATCLVKTEGKTGVEMEALMGVSTTLLTIYDMCKAIDKAMVISNIHLLEKSGGKSGNFTWKE